ncbi:MAG: hypothetical protein V7K86_12430 [Nostoc sp.]|uniref:hypothetical protein n=1 Tax=Nostoc sp. TaxID=1180 RepID=UPI002FF61DB8
MSTFTVTNTNNSGAGSLRQAVLDANALTGKDIINFGGLFTDGLAHTINLTGSSLSITDNLTIEGTNPSLLTIKDDTADRVFDIGKGVTAAINGLTITNTYDGASGGGGISNEGVLTLSNSIITGNRATNNTIDPGGNPISAGGGIYNTGSLTVNYSIITDNTISQNDLNNESYRFGTSNTGSYGGGIYNTGSLTLNHSTITRNEVIGGIGYGGGIWDSGSLMINHSTINDNTATDGGGIDNAGSLTVNNSTISGNTVSYDGGGIDNEGGLTTVNNSTISGNRAFDGGGIFNYDSLTVNYSTISGNSATSSGGGISIFDEGSYYPQFNKLMSIVSNSTISDNTSHFGGGIWNDGTLTVGNSTIRHNKVFGMEFSTTSGIELSYVPGNGGGIYNYNSPYGTATVDYSTIACNFDTPQEDSTKVIKSDDLVGKFISKGHDNWIGNLSGSTFSYS